MSKIFSLSGLVSLLVSCCTITAVAAQTEPTEGVCVSDLAPAIAKVTGQPQWRRSRWGILVQNLTTGQTLYAEDAEKFFAPASNTKLLTTAAALLTFGRDWQIETAAYATGDAPRLDTLRLIGRADPSITGLQLRELARQLRQQGITEIDRLIVNDSYIQAGIHPTWEWEDVYAYYGVAINSLIVDENAVVLELIPQQVGEPVKLKWSSPIAAAQWQVDNQAVTAPEGTQYSVEIGGALGKPTLVITGELAADSQADVWGLAVLDPAEAFLRSLIRALAVEGITISRGEVETESVTQPGETLATIQSPSIVELVKTTNRDSNNLYADVLLQHLQQRLGTTEATATLTEALTPLNFDSDGMDLVDGSGLSRHNLLSPSVVVQTLVGMTQTPYFEEFRDSLPVAGKNGTLSRRFQSTIAQGRVQAKTGTLTGVSALSGYIDPPEYQSLVFSIMINGAEASVSTQRQAIDEIVVMLTDLQRCD